MQKLTVTITRHSNAVPWVFAHDLGSDIWTAQELQDIVTPYDQALATMSGVVSQAGPTQVSENVVILETILVDSAAVDAYIEITKNAAYNELRLEKLIAAGFSYQDFTVERTIQDI